MSEPSVIYAPSFIYTAAGAGRPSSFGICIGDIYIKYVSQWWHPTRCRLDGNSRLWVRLLDSTVTSYRGHRKIANFVAQKKKEWMMAWHDTNIKFSWPLTPLASSRVDGHSAVSSIIPRTRCQSCQLTTDGWKSSSHFDKKFLHFFLINQKTRKYQLKKDEEHARIRLGLILYSLSAMKMFFGLFIKATTAGFPTLFAAAYRIYHNVNPIKQNSKRFCFKAIPEKEK